MPEPLPSASQWFESESYDDPPATQPSSSSRTRRMRLQRALQNTTDLAQEVREGLSSRRRRRSPSENEATSVANENDLRRWRSKRRRIEPPVVDEVMPAIQYGYFGQVEPGRLRMELLSCDGGEHVDNRYPYAYLGAKNCLKHDKSVYCSERANTNLVVVHADHNAFCLEKLHILAPETDFTNPVREGLVYVAMTVRDLQQYIDPPYHARQRGVHSPPYHQQTMRASPERLSLSDALQDPEVSAAFGQPRSIPTHEDLDWHTEETMLPSTRRNGRSPSTRPDFACEPPQTSIEYVEGEEPGDTPLAFLVDEDAGPEDVSSQDVLDFRLERRHRHRRFEIDEWMREDRRPGLVNAHARENTSVANAVEPPRLIGVEAGMKDDKVACARFHIKEGKHKVAIRFVPPASGRFILLKLWAGKNKSNVDVQTIIAQGYGALRFFPAKSFR